MTVDPKDPREEAKAAWDDWTEEDRRVELEALKSLDEQRNTLTGTLRKVVERSEPTTALVALATLTLDALRRWALEEDGEIPDFALDAYNAAAKVLGEKTIPQDDPHAEERR
jgi:hypothetical protein